MENRKNTAADEIRILSFLRKLTAFESLILRAEIIVMDILSLSDQLKFIIQKGITTMINRQTAKEKSKTLLRTRTFFDYVGFGQLLIAYFVLLVMPIVNCFAAIFFKVGMIRSSLRMNRGDKNVRVADIALAGDLLGRGIAINLWKSLFIFIWNLPGLAVAGIGILIGIQNLSLSIMVLCGIVAVTWCILITIYKTLQYQFAEYVAEDNRDYSGYDCVNESSSLTHGHKWELFVLSLSFLGWQIIAVILLINIWYTPYVYLTYASVYEQLKGTFKSAPKAEMLWSSNGSSVRVPGGHIPENRGDSGAASGAVSGNHALEVISGEYAGTNFPIADGDEIRIGRDPKRANVVIPMGVTAISGMHCSIRYNGTSNRYLITDFSTNGTYLNNQRLQKEISVSAAPGEIVKLAEGSMIIRLA